MRISRGFALVEVMVALVVMLAGIGAMARMLTLALQQERDAGTRRVALRLAASYAEELRGLRRLDGRACLAAAGQDPVAACAGEAGACAIEELAYRTWLRWQAQAQATLPQGSVVVVSIPDAARNDYLIELHWPVTSSGQRSLLLPVRA